MPDSSRRRHGLDERLELLLVDEDPIDGREREEDFWHSGVEGIFQSHLRTAESMADVQLVVIDCKSKHRGGFERTG